MNLTWPLLQVRTTLNMLGPLLNPAGAVYGLIGVYSPDISMLMAEALQQLGTRKALVVHSQVHTPLLSYTLLTCLNILIHDKLTYLVMEWFY